MSNITPIFGGAFIPPTPKAEIVEVPEVQFRRAIEQAGLNPPDEIIADGALHRFSGTRKHDKSSWYVAHTNGLPIIVFGEWKLGSTHHFKAHTGFKMNPAEEMEAIARIEKAKKLREAERERMNNVTASTVETIWENATEASPDHAYLKRKGIGPHGAKVTGDGRLIVPLFGDDGVLSSLQYIDTEGNKLFHASGATLGKFCVIGSMDEPGVIYIAEGFATAATVHEVMGRPCVVAYGASNLVPVTNTIRQKYGIAQDIVIVADNDKVGIGQNKAEQACAKHGANYIMPPIEGDANDYLQAGHDLKALLTPSHQDAEIINKLQAIFADDLSDEYQAPNELIENMMTIGGSTVLYGDSNSGKTFLALSIAYAIATGSDFFGRKVDMGLVVYLATESPSSVLTRIQALKKYYKVPLENLVIVPVPVNFYSGDGDAHDVIGLVKALSHKYGMPVHLIIGDTLARMSAGANENSGEDMGPVMARFDQVANATKSAIMIIHHNGKNAAAGARGWSGIRAHIDTEIEVTESNGMRIATITKQRELPGKGDEFCFKLEIVEMGVSKFGSVATTCVAVPDGDGVPVKRKAKTKSDELYLELRKAWFDSKCEFNNNEPYISRSALRDFFEKQGKSQRTITNKLDSSRKGDFIYTLLNENKITEFQNGWCVIDDDWVTDMNLRKNG